MFKFRSGMHVLNEELGRHSVLWECPAYSSCREAVKAKVKELIGDSFEQLSDIDKTAYVLGSEVWEKNFEDTLD